MIKHFLFTSIFLVGCGTVINQDKEAMRKKWGYDHWNADLKSKVLCDCILAGLNDKKIAADIRARDRSFASPVNFILFDSVSKEAIKPIVLQMNVDSAKSVASVSENIAGKKIFKSCLEFYQSAKLDSIVKSQQAIWEKITNIDSLVSRRIPSY